MLLNGAEILVQALRDEGVTDIFGYPGGALLEIFDALDKSPINNVLVSQEQGAVHEASGYARAKNTVGVCIATSGPGATNLVTGIATAYMDSIPVVAITGQVAKHLIGTDAFQETDITGIKNAMATKEEPEERLTALLDDISQRLETVEILSGQNYVDLIKLRRIK